MYGGGPFGSLLLPRNSTRNDFRHVGIAVPCSMGRKLLPSSGRSGVMPAIALIVGARSTLSTGWVFVVAEVVHGARTISGTFVDSWYGQILPPSRCSPQRKPLSLVYTITVWSSSCLALSSATIRFTPRSSASRDSSC